jgi:hypothetical protein
MNPAVVFGKKGLRYLKFPADRAISISEREENPSVLSAAETMAFFSVLV